MRVQRILRKSEQSYCETRASEGKSLRLRSKANGLPERQQNPRGVPPSTLNSIEPSKFGSILVFKSFLRVPCYINKISKLPDNILLNLRVSPLHYIIIHYITISNISYNRINGFKSPFIVSINCVFVVLVHR